MRGRGSGEENLEKNLYSIGFKKHTKRNILKERKRTGSGIGTFGTFGTYGKFYYTCTCEAIN